MSTSHHPEDDDPRPGERAGVAGLTPVSEEDRGADEASPWERKSGDAGSAPDDTRDPLSGRPGNVSEAQRVKQDHELEHQAPGRMASPREPTDAEHARALIEDLVRQGVARERAEELVKTFGADPDRLKAEVWVEENLDGPSKTEK